MKSETGMSWDWGKLSNLAKQRIAQSLDAGNSIVYDTLNDTVHNRDELRQLAQQHDAKAVIVFTNTPIDIIRQRQQQNTSTQHRHTVSEDKLQEAITRFEPPTQAENAVLFTSNKTSTHGFISFKLDTINRPTPASKNIITVEEVSPLIGVRPLNDSSREMPLLHSMLRNKLILSP